MTTPVVPGALGRWLPSGEHALHPMLIALLLLILVVWPLTQMEVLPDASLGAGMLVVILAGLLALDGVRHRRRWLMLAVILGGFALQGTALAAHRRVPPVVDDVGAILSLSMLGAAILRQTFAAGRVTVRRIEGAIAAYLLLGLIFAAAYEMVNTLAPGAFDRYGAPMGADAFAGNSIFFSFITLSTTGYGDIVPVHPVAQSLTVLEIVSGTLFTTVLLARLVSLELADRRRG